MNMLCVSPPPPGCGDAHIIISAIMLDAGAIRTDGDRGGKRAMAADDYYEVIDPRASRGCSTAMRRSTGCSPAVAGPRPAWFGGGRYLVWSDIPNNRMLRYDETDGGVSVFPAGGQFQRQYGRPAGAARHLRAFGPARQPARARRHGDHHRRQLERQALQLAQRRGGEVRTARSGSPIRATASTPTTRATRPKARSGRATSTGSIPTAARSRR